MANRPALCALVPLLASAPSWAQFSDIDPGNKHSWGENIGWMNWRDAGSPPASQGVRIHGTFLSGSIWCENVGYIRVGDATPANGVSYANVNGTDYGVNLDPGTGTLSGLGWGENIGWVNFAGGLAATPARPARISPSTGHFSGFAWAPNVGWISLGNADFHVGRVCTADYNGDTSVDDFDFFDFLNDFFFNRPAADFNGDTSIDDFDYFDFLNAFFGGC
ncbi:MAG: hypothetical protein JNM07_11805 [Phycisphaerae bacterium]|nr:hypothetical protein [Phycisphaerae bacterium]